MKEVFATVDLLVLLVFLVEEVTLLVGVVACFLIVVLVEEDLLVLLDLLSQTGALLVEVACLLVEVVAFSLAALTFAMTHSHTSLISSAVNVEIGERVRNSAFQKLQKVGPSAISAWNFFMLAVLQMLLLLLTGEA